MSELLTALGNLTANYEELAAVTLFSIGLCMLLFARNLIKKVIGLDIMDTGVFLLLATSTPSPPGLCSRASSSR